MVLNPMIKRIWPVVLALLLLSGPARAQDTNGVTLNPGLATSPTVYNPGTQVATNRSTLYRQLLYDPHASSCTINSTCGSTNDSGKLLTATAAGVTFTLPAAGAAGPPGYTFGYDGSHNYTVTTVSGYIYGACGGATSSASGLTTSVSFVPDGVNWLCVASSAAISQTLFVGTISNGGSGNAYTLTLTAGTTQVLPGAYQDGLLIVARLGPGATPNGSGSGITLSPGGSLAAVAVYRQSDIGANSAFTGGELQNNNQEYCFTYSTAVSGFINWCYPGGGISLVNASQTNTSGMWASGRMLVANTAGVTFTQPQLSTLGAQGGIILSCPVFPCAVQPNSNDTIQGAAPANPIFLQGLAFVIGDNGNPNGNYYINFAGLKSDATSWQSGFNFHTAPVPIFQNDHTSRPITIVGLSCLIEAVTGTTGDNFGIYDGAPGLIPTTAGIAVHTTTCNGNASAGTVQSMFAPNSLVNVYTLSAGHTLYAVSSQWSGTSGGTGVIKIKYLD